MKKVLIFDTSIMCVWLQVPGKDTCTTKDNTITYDSINKKIEEEKKNGTTFILPIASIIETGNHIAHSAGDKYDLGGKFANLICDTANSTSPWAAFTEQSTLWKPENLVALADRWKKSVVAGQSIGDASIVEVAEYYAKLGFEVEIYTGDEDLKSYQPISKAQIPRRRRK